MKCCSTLTILIYLLVAPTVQVLSVCRSKSTFSLLKADSSTVPEHFKSYENIVANRMQCPMLCKLKLEVCFGFYMLKSSPVCRLFNASAYFNNNTWVAGSEPAAVYTLSPTVESGIRIVSCNQSSTDYGADCSRAIDGNLIQHFSQHSCTHTVNEPNSWWEVQLAQVSKISAVKVYNRQDCCAHRLNKFTVLIDGVECAAVDRTQSFSTLTVNCASYMYGSRVRIGLPSGSLTLCEVEIFGVSPGLVV